MSHTKKLRGIGEFKCDGSNCKAVVKYENNQFMETLDRLKKQGWFAAKTGTKWEHFCPTCANKYR